jgi:hypothetical protein
VKEKRFKVGQVVVLDGNGCYNGVGVPVSQNGRWAKVLRVGYTKLQVLLAGESLARYIKMTDVRRIAKQC